MQIIRGLLNFKSKSLATSKENIGHIVTIGNYDGIHLGHQKIIQKTVNIARETSLPSILVTFEPQPRDHFLPSATPRHLMSFREKIITIANFGIDKIIFLHFNDQFAKLDAASFITEILIKKLNAKHVVIGEDFIFGYKNSGDAALLKQYGTKLSFKVSAIPIYKVDGQRVSSSLIRKCLAHDDLKTAQELLGRPYSALGRIVAGDKRGRDLGFPTANIHLKHKVIPLAGVYVIKAWIMKNSARRIDEVTDKEPLYGVANIGFRPTVGNSKRSLEVYLFNFNQNIYNKIMRVEFIYKLRNEKKFVNFKELQQQIAKDIEQAKAYFSTIN